MNIFRIYVKRNLKLNKLRTTMTILGIILSMALITAVIEGGYSGLEYVREVLKGTYGSFHGYFYNCTKEDVRDLTADPQVEQSVVYKTLGWADIGSTNSTKPYLLIKETTPDIVNLVNLDIIDGRMPENSSEILISEHLSYNGNVEFKTGDTITVTPGKRYLNGNVIMSDDVPFTSGEYLLPLEKDNESHTYTVVGIMSRFSYYIENYYCPGYTAITISDDISNIKDTEYGVFYSLTDAAGFNEFVGSFSETHPYVKSYKNRELVALYGGISDRSYFLFILGFILILIFLIVFGTVALIYNSFSISVSERTKQIGILKSIGATKKQIRRSIFYEAFFECIIAIPLGLVLGCSGIGATLYLMQEGFSNFIAGFGGYTAAINVKIGIVLNFPLLLVSVLLVVFTVVISAIIPALRASSVSPLDSIRQNNDIRIKSHHLKQPRIFAKIFGIEGMLASRNYNRNRKRYRATIVSLALSIILFIAASSFCSYLGDAISDEFYEGNMSLIYYVDTYTEDGEPMDEADYDNIFRILSSSEAVHKVIRVKQLYDSVIQDPNLLYEVPDNSYESMFTDEVAAPDTFDETSENMYDHNAELFFIDNNSFKELLENEGIEYSPDSIPQAVVYNYGVFYSFDEEGNRKKFSYNFTDDDSLPKNISCNWYNIEYVLDNGYIVMTETIDKNGEVYLVYFSEEDINTFYDNIMYSEENVEDIDIFDSLLQETLQSRLDLGLPTDKAPTDFHTNTKYEFLDNAVFVKKSLLEHSIDISIIGTTYNKDYAFTSVPAIILPYSDIISETMLLDNEEFLIYSSDPNATEKDINLKLTENNYSNSGVYNHAANKQNTNFLRKFISIFSYGFVLLISLVAIANVFNTISTNIALRRREFGMLKSMGLSNRGIGRMLNIECLIYGIKSVLLGLPIAILVTYAVYKVTNNAFSITFYVPWYSVVIAIAAVFTVVFITMMYASRKIKKDNTIDALKNENI